MNNSMLSLQILPRYSDPAQIPWDKLPQNEAVRHPDQAVYRVVDGVIELIKSTGLEFQVAAFETTITGPLPQLLEIVERSHALCHALGCDRVLSVVKIDTARRSLGFEEKLHKYNSTSN